MTTRAASPPPWSARDAPGPLTTRLRRLHAGPPDPCVPLVSCAALPVSLGACAVRGRLRGGAMLRTVAGLRSTVAAFGSSVESLGSSVEGLGSFVVRLESGVSVVGSLISVVKRKQGS